MPLKLFLIKDLLFSFFKLRIGDGTLIMSRLKIL